MRIVINNGMGEVNDTFITLIPIVIFEVTINNNFLTTTLCIIVLLSSSVKYFEILSLK